MIAARSRRGTIEMLRSNDFDIIADFRKVLIEEAKVYR